MTVLDICTCTLYLVEKLWLYKVLQVFQYNLFKTLFCFIKYLMNLYFLCKLWNPLEEKMSDASNACIFLFNAI